MHALLRRPVQFATGSIEYRPWHRSSADWLYTPSTPVDTPSSYIRRATPSAWHRSKTKPGRVRVAAAGTCRRIINTWRPRDDATVPPSYYIAEESVRPYQSTTTTNTRREQQNNNKKKKHEYKNRRRHVCSSWDVHYTVHTITRADATPR